MTGKLTPKRERRVWGQSWSGGDGMEDMRTSYGGVTACPFGLHRYVKDHGGSSSQVIALVIYLGGMCVLVP